MNTINRKRLLNAVVFFAKNTRYCGKIKLFKLLYLLDFEHFRKTGRSVTGAEYAAWKFGPVPEPLYEEWEKPEADFLAAIEIKAEQVADYVRQTVKPKREFDDSLFSPRQIALLTELAAKYRDTQSPEMIDVTHADDGAWSKVWNDGIGRNARIAYELSLSPDDPYRDAVLDRQRSDVQRQAAISHAD